MKNQKTYIKENIKMYVKREKRLVVYYESTKKTLKKFLSRISAFIK